MKIQIIKHKKKIQIASFVIAVILIGFFISESIQRSGYFTKEYGINLTIFAWVFITAEFLFNIGIVLMLKGSGVFRIRFKHIKNFDFSRIRFSGKVVYFGFIINRIAAFFPWLYPLWAGWGKLPPLIVSLIVVELLIVALIGFSIKIPRNIIRT